MAQFLEAAGTGEALLTWNHLAAVSTDLKQHITCLIESNLENINTQLKTLNDSLKDVVDTANRGFEMATSNEKAVIDIKTSEKALKDRLSILELRSRALNIKFQGVPELDTINKNLSAFGLRLYFNWERGIP